MKLKQKLFFSKALCLVFTVLVACVSFLRIKKPPEVQVEGVEFAGLTDQGAAFVARLKVTNPNQVEIQIDHLNYNLKVEDKAVAMGELERAVTIPAGASVEVEAPIKVVYKNIIQSALSLVTQDHVAYQLDGEVRSGLLHLPFSQRGDLKQDLGPIQKTK